MLAADSLFDGANPLSDREREVLRLAADGRSAAADRLRGVPVGGNREKPPLSDDREDREATNRAQAVRIAQDKGWI